MVLTLRSALCRLLCLLILGGAAISARAQSGIVKGIFKYRVTNSVCLVKVKTEDGFVTYKRKIPVGTLAIGKPSPKSPEIILFKTAETRRLLLAAKKSCIFANSGKTKGEEGAVDLSIRKRVIFTLGTFHWQEGISITYEGIKTALRSTTVAAGMSFQMMWANDDRERGIGAQIVYGKAQVALANEPTNGSNVQEFGVSNVDVAGAIISPTYMWRPSSGNVAFGFQVPIFFRYGAFPLPADIAERASIGPRLKFTMGAMIESRFERGKFVFTQKVGFLGIPKSLAWGLDAGWRF